MNVLRLCIVIAIIAICHCKEEAKSFGITEFRNADDTERIRRSLSRSSLDQDEKQEIVDIHNTLRKSVEPPSSNMQHMFWNDQLADMAQTWAEGCKWEHGQPEMTEDPEYISIGQNMWKGGHTSVPRATQAWDSERKFFHYQDASCDDNQMCGHYTQVVWATSKDVGCGVADCGTYNMIVCNYGPRGNYAGAQPYKTGVSCSECPVPSWCYEALCMPSCPDTRDNECECSIKCDHCGIRHENNCSCTCATGWMGHYCTDQCGNIDDRCANGWYPNWCDDPKHKFVSNKCQMMCGICEPLPEGTTEPVCCDGKQCGNNGDLNAATCTCECTNDYSGDLCEIPVEKSGKKIIQDDDTNISRSAEVTSYTSCIALLVLLVSICRIIE
ncbi:cysteine-rich venom protein latisemin-like isoform X2 [Saccoglossus kowalevskii]|uniref:Peptidase inhibitor 15-A-like n=1 Tax=Saccoglossus kowalevskii TaxID=10224 RepID=A0ABM0ML44_SACKO|nr:PREDICTED: peptidase inhibitor 15-A-like [Saccoglossus kowalevskii]